MGQKNLLESIIERIQFWIGNVDAKVSFLLSMSAVLLGFIFTSDSIDNTLTSYLEVRHFDWKAIIAVINGLIYIATLFFVIVAIKKFLSALKGRIDSTVYRQLGLELKSLIYWGTIAERVRYTDFKNDLEGLTEESLLNDLRSQVYINSKITKEKFEEYNKGIKALSWGIILLVIFKLISYIPL